MMKRGITANWVKALLFFAFVYSAGWGLAVLFFPHLLFVSNSVDLPNYIYLWQTIGLIEVTLGMGYLIALNNPYKHWTPIALGLIYKLASSVIFFMHAWNHEGLWTIRSYIILDNLIWVIPFIILLVYIYRRTHLRDDILVEMFSESDQFSLDLFETSEGMSLEQMTYSWPTMVVFLRHFGCTFCRETLADVASKRAEIDATGTRIVFVHMIEDELEAQNQLNKFGLGDIPHISDPEKILYKKFKLRKGNFIQLFGPKIWFRGMLAGMFKGLGVGKEMGDSMQMPGLFLMFKGQIVKEFIHKSAADRPEYVHFAECTTCHLA